MEKGGGDAMANTEEKARKCFYCPFYIGERRRKGKYVLNCEGGRITMPDAVSRRVLVYGSCAHPEAWKKCAIAVALNRYYDQQ